jgi:hypothetical protein
MVWLKTSKAAKRRQTDPGPNKICRPFRALEKNPSRILGLTPQAMNLSPLRGLTEWRPVLFLGLTPQAMSLSPLRGLMEWRPLPFLGLTPQAKYLSPLRG